MIDHSFCYSIIFLVFIIALDYLLLFRYSVLVTRVLIYNQYFSCILGLTKNNSARSSFFSIKKEWMILLQMQICFWVTFFLKEWLVFMIYSNDLTCSGVNLYLLKGMILVMGVEFFPKITIHIFCLLFLFYYPFNI